MWPSRVRRKVVRPNSSVRKVWAWALGEAGEDFWAGVAEVVAEAVGDDGVGGGDGGEEVGSGGGEGAVVADFEEGDGGEGAGGEHGAFGWGFGVAFEQDGGFAVGDAEDEGVVVFGGCGVGVGGVGGENFDLFGAPGEGLAGVEPADCGAVRAGLAEEGGEGVGLGGDGDPELAGVEVAEDRGHAAHVVGVGVGEDEGVEAANAAGPEVGGLQPLRQCRRRRWRRRPR